MINAEYSDEAVAPTTALPEPLDPAAAPPHDRYCDLVLNGGVIDGVVFPGFLMEVARQFRFRSIGGTSVGALAAALAAACEYSRRYNRDTGFNEGLRKLPETLGKWVDQTKTQTKLRSLFQPDPKIKPLFEFVLDWINDRNTVAKASVNSNVTNEPRGSTLKSFLHFLHKLSTHFIPIPNPFLFMVISVLIGSETILWSFVHSGDSPPDRHRIYLWIGLIFTFWVVGLVWSVMSLGIQIYALFKTNGFGACSGIGVEGNPNQGLIEWLHEGVQKAAGLPLSKPLTFNDLWSAPGGPSNSDGQKLPYSIDMSVITTCLSHGRAYELPLKDSSSRLFFKLSELKHFFPDDIIQHLRFVSKPLKFRSDPIFRSFALRRIALRNEVQPLKSQAQSDMRRNRGQIRSVIKQTEKGFNDPDIRELPSADLPLVVAVRMSFAVPGLFKALPLLGFDLVQNAEDMRLVRLWFSDGGLVSNFPIHLFDKALPRWPTFGIKIEESSPVKNSNKSDRKSYVPYYHLSGIEDNLLATQKKNAFVLTDNVFNFSSFCSFLSSIYHSTKDGTDQSFMRMPDVRNRVVRIYINDKSKGALNLMIEPKDIRDLGCDAGVNAGKNLVNSYLGIVTNPKYAWTSLWSDHRWVRFNLLVESLRQYLNGFGQSVNNPNMGISLINQIHAAQTQAPLKAPQDKTEYALTPEQARQLSSIVTEIQNLERSLSKLNLPVPYQPSPMPILRLKPVL
jgi:predicted acylesterase/phospholipase RssA